MKFIHKIIILSWLIVHFINPVNAQDDPILNNFNAIENNGTVIISWEISAGSTCNGIQIYRSTDSINFVQIWEIPGVCGNISQPQYYDYTDPAPVNNRTNFYRLQLGNIGFSGIVSVDIRDISAGGYQIQPNPSSSDFKIYFDNFKSRINQIDIYNSIGVKFFSSQSSGTFFHVDVNSFPSGNYIFTISNSGDLNSIKGKFAVIH